MASFVKCTRTDKSTIFINLDHVVSIAALKTPAGQQPITEIIYGDAKRDTIIVIDDAEILASAGRAYA